MNKENLIPLNTLPKSHQREIQQKGTRAAAKSRAEKKALKDALLILLNSEHDTADGKADGFAALGAALFKQALNGNVRAYEVIRDTIGEKPVETIAIDNTAEMREAYERAAAAIKGLA